MGEPRSIAILKPGTFTDIRGTKVTFTRADLAEIASSYDAKKARAPLVLGHPGPAAPSFGWVDRMEIVGDHLRAHPTELVPAFAEAVAVGHYRKVSPQLYPPRSPTNPTPGRWHLQHVGFLGAAPPAIKGMGIVAFGEVRQPGTVAVTIDGDRPVSFAAPAGYAVDDRSTALHARARAIQEAHPAMQFWDAVVQARHEAAIVSFAEQAGDDPASRGRADALLRARSLQAGDPRLSFWDAFVLARAQSA